MRERLFRVELIESDRWLSKKIDNADRAAWLACALTCDNFGDMPAGLLRLARLWRPYMDETEERAQLTLVRLSAVDLIRPYEAAAAPYLHIPRFGQRTRWVGNNWPLSPWATNEDIQRVAKKTRADRGGTPLEVEVEVDLKQPALKPHGLVDSYIGSTPKDKVIPNPTKTAVGQNGKRKPADGRGQNWKSATWVYATAKTLGILRRTGEDEAGFTDRVYTAVQAARRKSAT